VTFTDVFAARAVGTPMDTPLHPSQLYESVAAFLIFFILLWLAPRKRFNGQVVLAYVALYSARAVGTPMDTPIHPSQLYESFATLLIFLVLLWLAPRKRFNGQVTLVYVALYSAVRFGLEFLRGDPDRGAWFGGTVSTSQIIAVGLLLGVALLLPRVRRTQAIATR
jgi:prolipoprotein diacylglyceryltransferase